MNLMCSDKDQFTAVHFDRGFVDFNQDPSFRHQNDGQNLVRMGNKENRGDARGNITKSEFPGARQHFRSL